MPGLVVVDSAMMACDQGAAPMALAVTSQQAITIDGLAVATVADCVPVTNIPPFGNCKLLTAAASGMPCPCVMVPAGMWTPGSAVQTINGLAVLTISGKLACGVGGMIALTEPGQALQESD